MSQTELTLNSEQPQAPALTLADSLAMRLLESPEINTETLREVLRMQNEQEDRRRAHEVEDRQWMSKLAFNKAFVKCKGEMPQIAKDAFNKQTSSSYAKMEAVDLAITPVMVENGFSVTFQNGGSPKDDSHLHIIATLIHNEGFEKDYDDQVPIAGVGIKGTRMMTATHGHGATKTYARRYLKLDIWDLALMDEDSDGNANNISEAAQDFLDQISLCENMSTMNEISASVSSAGRKLPPNDLPRVRRAWVDRRTVIEASDKVMSHA